jgi:peptidoglycan lytic transglycosylase
VIPARKTIYGVLTGAALVLVAFCALLIATPPVHAKECGTASWYGPTGHLTASGQVYRGKRMIAAHRSLPFGTRVRVALRGSGKSIVVEIQDRGPFIRGRIIDLSPVAARRLGFYRAGVASVCVSVVR